MKTITQWNDAERNAVAALTDYVATLASELKDKLKLATHSDQSATVINLVISFDVLDGRLMHGGRTFWSVQPEGSSGNDLYLKGKPSLLEAIERSARCDCGNFRVHQAIDDTVSTFPDVVIQVDKVILDEDGRIEKVIPIDKAARKNKPQNPT